MGVIGRTGECEAYSHGFFIEFGNDLLKSAYHSGKTQIQVMCIGRHCYRVNDEVVGAHGSEHKVGAAGIKRNYDAVVEFVHIFIL